MATGNLSPNRAKTLMTEICEIIRISRICVNNRPQEYTAIHAAYPFYWPAAYFAGGTRGLPKP